MQLLPELSVGGVEQGTIDSAAGYIARGHHSVVIAAGGRRVPELTAAGSVFYALPIHKKRPLNAYLMISKVARIIREEGVDVVHARSRVPAWIAYWAARRAGVPWVTTVHGFYSANPYSRIMVRGDRVIAVSRSVADYAIQSLHGDPGRLTVVNRGVDRKQYPYGWCPDPEWLDRWRRQYPQLEGKLVVTMPGRLARWKGQTEFIRVMETLSGAGRPVHGLIVGDAHPRKIAFREELQAEVARRGLSDSITFTGHRSDMKQVLAVSDVVVSLSTDPEAFGRTTLEALSLGIPVVGYNHGGVGEMLSKLLPSGAVAVGDAEAVAGTILDWGERPPEVAREHEFTLDNMVDQTLAVYRDAVRASEGR